MTQISVIINNIFKKIEDSLVFTDDLPDFKYNKDLSYRSKSD
jgi:hypothetical protein